MDGEWSPKAERRALDDENRGLMGPIRVCHPCARYAVCVWVLSWTSMGVTYSSAIPMKVLRVPLLCCAVWFAFWFLGFGSLRNRAVGVFRVRGCGTRRPRSSTAGLRNFLSCPSVSSEHWLYNGRVEGMSRVCLCLYVCFVTVDFECTRVHVSVCCRNLCYICSSLLLLSLFCISLFSFISVYRRHGICFGTRSSHKKLFSVEKTEIAVRFSYSVFVCPTYHSRTPDVVPTCSYVFWGGY